MALDRSATLRSHWRPSTEWTGGDYVTWHLLPAPDGPVATAATRVAAALAAVTGLEPVPVPWLHLTLQGVAERADLTADDVDAVVAAVRAAVQGIPAPELTFDPPAVHLEGVLLEGGPAEPVAAVRSAVRRGLLAAVGRAPGTGDEPVWPHVSLAYCHVATGAAGVLDAVGSAAGAPAEVTETFSELSLLALRREGRRYVWDVLATVPLG